MMPIYDRKYVRIRPRRTIWRQAHGAIWWSEQKIKEVEIFWDMNQNLPPSITMFGIEQDTQFLPKHWIFV